MVGRNKKKVIFEALFVRHDGELETLMDDVLIICSNFVD